MRKKLVAGNWKMNFTAVQAASFVETFSAHPYARPHIEVLICPSYLSLWKVRDLVRNTPIQVGAQNVFWADSGAFTGFVSPPMLREAGVTYCIVGHSETRGRFGRLEVPESTVGYFAESDATVNLKVKALLYHAIRPILCVGETACERDAGQTEQVIAGQLRSALEGIDGAELGGLVLAYEPVWAIGTGRTCDSAEANRVCGFIRSELAAVYDDGLANDVRILYGGSVKSSNASGLFSEAEIDGGLVGGASLDPDEFCRIVMAA
jgi:triosephosphate isomerase